MGIWAVINTYTILCGSNIGAYKKLPILFCFWGVLIISRRSSQSSQGGMGLGFRLSG